MLAAAAKRRNKLTLRSGISDSVLDAERTKEIKIDIDEEKVKYKVGGDRCEDERLV